MGGGEQFNDLMKNLTKGMGKGMKFNKGAFNAMQKEFESKERLREKIKKRKEATLEKKSENQSVFKIVDEEQQKTAILKAQKDLEELLAQEEKEKTKDLKPKTKSKKKKKKKN
jgi:hypothetical protein